MAAYARTPDTSTVPFELRRVQGNQFIPNGSTAVDLRVFASCGDGGPSDDTPVRLAEPNDLPMYRSSPVLVLISLSVHQNIELLRQQLRNIAAFAPRSVVVLHVAPTWAVDMRSIERFNRTAHPHIIINPHRFLHSKQNLAQIQLYNARYVAEAHPWVPWTHVVLFASNELFVRSGIERYLQHLDLSFPGRPRPRQAVSVMHSFNFSRPDIRFVDPGDGARSFDFWRLARGDGGLHGEFAFNRMLQLLGLKMYATHQLYTEGTFYNRSIAVRLSTVLDVLFDEADGDCLDSWMSVSEAFVLQILQNSCGQRRSPAEDVVLDPQLVPSRWNHSEARQLMAELSTATCGDKTGTVSWMNPSWVVDEQDIYAARCSPFEGPFSFKRFHKFAGTPVRNVVTALRRDPRRLATLREPAKFSECERLRWAV